MVVVAAASGALVVEQHGPWREEVAPARLPEAQAQVDVLVVRRVVLVEAPTLGEELAFTTIMQAAVTAETSRVHESDPAYPSALPAKPRMMWSAVPRIPRTTPACCTFPLG